MKGKSTKQTSYADTKSMYCVTDCVSNDYSHISSFYSGKQLTGAWDGASTWNREHTWPNSKGLGGNDENDIMMLRPTWVQENSSRGNTAYGQSSGYYDPGLSTRGDCARIVLYVYTRWGNTSYMWGKSGVMENMNVLLSWMAEDPVDTWEMGRNDAVQSITGVRNVFVDYPELAWYLFGQQVPANYSSPSNAGAGSTPVQVQSLSLNKTTLSLDVGETNALSVTALPQGASNNVTWSSSNASVATVSSAGVVTAVGKGTATITATSASNLGVKATLTVTVTQPKQAVQLVVEGTPTALLSAGQAFVPDGLTIKVIYDDDSSKTVDANSCIWQREDGTATLAEGEQRVVCKWQNLTSSPLTVTASGTVSQNAFGQAVLDAQNASTQSALFSAISNAFNKYDALTQQEKDSDSTKQWYAKLTTAVQNYNATAEQQNQALANAVTDMSKIAVSSIVATALALLAYVFVSKKH